MSLSVATNVSLDTIKNLDASKTYFLSSTTGEVKEASLMMRFKCWLGVSSARQKVANLVDAVRTTLLKSADATQNAALDNDIRNVRLNEMVKGSVIKDIASRFSAANRQTIAKAAAAKLAADVAGTAATKISIEQYNSGKGFVDTDAIASIVNHALKPSISGDLPMHTDMYDEQVLDEYHLKQDHLSPKADEISALVLNIMKSDKLGGEKIDKLYAKHIIDTLFNKDGTPSGKTIADLKTPLQVKVDFAFKLKEKTENHIPRESSIYGALKNANVNPEEKLATILEFCGGDDDLKEYVLEIAPHLCVNSEDALRDDDEIKKKLSDIKAGLSEIGNIELHFPGSAPALKFAMKTLGASSFANGLLKDLAAEVGNHRFDKLKNLNSLSKAEDIYDGIDELRQLVAKVDKKLGRKYSSGPEGVFIKNAVVALAMSKLGPGFVARLPGILRGTEFGIMNKTIDDLNDQAEVLERDKLIPDASKAKKVIDDMYVSISMVQGYCNVSAGHEIEFTEVQQIDRDSDTSQRMLYTLSISEQYPS